MIKNEREEGRNERSPDRNHGAIGDISVTRNTPPRQPGNHGNFPDTNKEKRDQSTDKYNVKAPYWALSPKQSTERIEKREVKSEGVRTTRRA